MDKCDSHRSLPYRRSAPLDGTMPHIAGCEDTWNVRLHIIRIALKLPARRPAAVLHQIGPGYEITSLIADDSDLLRPLRVRQPAQAKKKPVGSLSPLLASLIVAQRDRTQHISPVKSNHFGA